MNGTSESQVAQPTEVRSDEGRLAEVSTLSTAGLIAGVLGLTAAVFGVLIYAIDPGAVSLTFLNLVFASGAIVFYALTNRASLARIASGRSTPLVVLEMMLVLGVGAGIVAANYFASKSTKEWDLTRDQLFTLQEQSQKVAAGLKADVQVIGFFKPTDPRRQQLERLVDLYGRHTPHIAADFINPDTATPAVVEKYQMTARSPRIVVVTGEGRQTKIEQPSEESLTNALVRVADRPPRKVYFLTGHGEPGIDDGQTDGGFKIAADDLVDEGYEVASVSLIDRENLPDDATVLVVAGSRSPLFPNEVQTINAWLKRGGRVLFLLEPGIDAGLDGVFRPFAIDVGDDLVVDPNPASKALGFGPDAPVVMKFEQHPITDPLAGQAVLFYWVRSVSPRIGVANTETTTLIQTSPTSWGEKKYADGGDVGQDQEDVPGPVPVALAVTRKTVVAPNKVNDEARIVVIGDSTFATNRFTTMSGNGDLFVNTINWLAGEEHRIAVRPKQRGASRIPLTEAQQYGIVFFSVNLLPLMLVGVGLSVWAVRRRL